MRNQDFHQGARVKPKPLNIAETHSYPTFVLGFCECAVRDYKQVNKEDFLRHVAIAFDFVLQSESQGKKEESK